MVTLCVCVPRLFEDITEYAERAGVFSIFGEAERERIENISSPVARALSLGGLIALQRLTVLSAVEEKGLEISRAEGGKPYFSGNNNYNFNISHSGELSVAVLSVGDSEIGVDIEAVDRERDPRKISERFFTSEEREELESCDFDRRTFYKLWTSKEARAKFGGEGLARLLSGKRECEGFLCHYAMKYSGREYIMTVCTSQAENIEIIQPDADVEIYKFQESVKK